MAMPCATGQDEPVATWAERGCQAIWRWSPISECKRHIVFGAKSGRYARCSLIWIDAQR